MAVEIIPALTRVNIGDDILVTMACRHTFAGLPQKGKTVPLQNRVDPFGAIHAAAGRGLFTGNRGVIHDPATKRLLARRWTTKAWIVCTLVHPRGRRREPMGRNAPSGGAGWTELFFLDEVTALAAGHRPCFYCRRAAAAAFQECFAAGNGGQASAPQMDTALHDERIAAGAVAPMLKTAELAALPDGAMIAVGGEAFAVRGGSARPWSFAGYGGAQRLPDTAQLLTPVSTVETLRAGYRPAWHESLTG